MAGNSRPGGIGPLDPIYDVETAYGAIAVGNTPGGAIVTVTINQASGQADPTNESPILFDVVFSESVVGFATGDVALTGTAVATLGTVSGSGAVYTVAASGMSGAGTVIATIPASVCVSSTTGIPNRPSTSTDNTVTYSEVIPNAIHWWDFNYAPNRVMSGSNILTITDRISNAVMTAQSAVGTGTTDIGSQGKTYGIVTASGGGAPQRLTTSGFLLTTQPIWASWIGRQDGAAGVVFDTKSTAPRPTFYTSTTWRLNAGLEINAGNDDSATHIFYVEVNGASSKIYVDNVLAVSGDVGSAAASIDASLFNNFGGNAGCANNRIGEILFGNGTNGAGVRTAEYNRLVNKWI